MLPDVFQGNGPLHHATIVHLYKTFVHVIEKQGLEGGIPASEGQSNVDQHPWQGCAGLTSILHGGQIEGDYKVALIKAVEIQQVDVALVVAGGI